MDNGVDYKAESVRMSGEQGSYFDITVQNCDYEVYIPAPGIHNVHNALAAIAAGVELGVPMEEIIKGIAQFSPGKMRLDIISHKGMKIINDAYNASPQSMEAAISVLKDVGAGRRTIAVLGDMLEMGDWAYKAHIGVGRFAVQKGIDCIVTVGGNGRNIAEGALEAGASPDKVFSFDSNREAAEFLKIFAGDGDVILVKGSRGMKMEEIVNRLTADDT